MRDLRPPHAAGTRRPPQAEDSRGGYFGFILKAERDLPPIRSVAGADDRPARRFSVYALGVGPHLRRGIETRANLDYVAIRSLAPSV